MAGSAQGSTTVSRSELGALPDCSGQGYIDDSWIANLARNGSVSGLTDKRVIPERAQTGSIRERATARLRFGGKNSISLIMVRGYNLHNTRGDPGNAADYYPGRIGRHRGNVDPGDVTKGN